MNPLNLPSELPIARYRLHFTLTHDLQLPSYAASTLRGVFGHALLAAACTCDTPQTPHLPDCPYAQIFEPAPCADLPSSVRGVVCGRGRNPTLRLWPAIFSGEIDVFPSERRNMGQEIGR